MRQKLLFDASDLNHTQQKKKKNNNSPLFIWVANASWVFLKQRYAVWDQICDAYMRYCTSMSEKWRRRAGDMEALNSIIPRMIWHWKQLTRMQQQNLTILQEKKGWKSVLKSLSLKTKQEVRITGVILDSWIYYILKT